MVAAFIRKGAGSVQYGGLGWGNFLTTQRADLQRRINDAYLQVDVVLMAPDFGGRIVELNVLDNQTVHRDDVLLRIDPVALFRWRQAARS